ncbi:hypothetical protein EQG63_09985 [Flavobacterium amnicola]|uniref:YhhN-like protein n=1 Tax=Flavobacterium amnicola TaxID=2506422 RepID=A0A4Q1K428_9FLAO|nr:hypothetical protein [Flavobacterium amnicola]RXR17803.1 hypothetical protein EQG63_09985 [Flavobacterium amnicola]
MNILKSHLRLYFIFGILYFLSTFMDWTYTSYFAKPLFIGAISFYYIEESRKNINYYNCIILIFFLISGVINLLEGFDYFVYVLFFNFLAYCMLLLQLIKELRHKKLYIIDKENYTSILLTFIFLACILYISSLIVFDSSFELYKVILVYDAILITFVFSAAYAYLAKPNQKNTYLIIYALITIMCELFYGIYYYYYKLDFLRFTSIFCYILSFYFLIHYFLKENDTILE